MGILDRINLLIRSNVGDLTRRSDSPDRALDRTIGEMESSLREARVQLSRCESAERSLHAKWRRTREEALDWEDKAMEELRRGDENRAREYLVEKHKVDARSKQLKEELEQQREYIADLARSLDALTVKLESATGRRRAMTSHIDHRDRRNDDDRPSASQQYSFPQSWTDDGTSSGRRGVSSRRAFAFDEDLRREYPEDVFGVSDPFDRFSDMEDRIGRFEANTAASRELYDDPLRDDLAERLDRMGRRQAADKGISDIKRRLLEDLEG